MGTDNYTSIGELNIPTLLSCITTNTDTRSRASIINALIDMNTICILKIIVREWGHTLVAMIFQYKVFHEIPKESCGDEI